nr:unnamed protein product [Rangifer tarandus platyrhynchus]
MQSLAGTARVKTTGERLGGKGTPALGALPPSLATAQRLPPGACGGQKKLLRAGWRAGGEVTRRAGERLAYQPDPSPPLPTPSLRVQRTLRRCLLPRVHGSGRNERSLTPCTAAPGFPLCARADAGREWLGCCMAGDSRCGAHPHGLPSAGGGALHRWRSPGDGCSEPAVTASSTQHPRAKLLPDPIGGSLGREGALLSQPQAPASQPQVPAPRSQARRRGPGDLNL